MSAFSLRLFSWLLAIGSIVVYASTELSAAAESALIVAFLTTLIVMIDVEVLAADPPRFVRLHRIAVGGWLGAIVGCVVMVMASGPVESAGALLTGFGAVVLFGAHMRKHLFPKPQSGAE